MPSINFVLPHWVYWLTLVVFPLLCMWAVARTRHARAAAGPKLGVAYLFWLCAGFAGLHRFYVRSRLGWLFLPLFLAVLYCNAEVKSARQEMSKARMDLRTSSYELDRAEGQVRRGTAGATERRDAAKARHDATVARMEQSTATHDHWHDYAGLFGLAIALFLLVDAALLPGLVRRQAEREAREPLRRFQPVSSPSDVHEMGTGEDPTLHVQTRASRWLDAVTNASGELVAYWTLLSIFVYYYEVVVRFVFNSPTNWVHESMFLMYGMQYLIAGAYGYKVDAHVRVDVFYVKFSERWKAIADLLTSVFFFIFVGTMLVTGWIFAVDSVRLGEVSFTEWGIQYWPVKIAVPVGAALLLLQGVSKFVKDIRLLRNGNAAKVA
jgi:TRAP-type mannitol/chloroaromatic compound transport system permease small subunit